MGMERLTAEHARKIHDALRPATGYSWRLVGRLVHVGLDVQDLRLMGLAADARNAMHALSVELHYQSCGHGAGPHRSRGGANCRGLGFGSGEA
jgi:hypothetical protein